MAIRLLSSESIDGALTLTGSLTGTTATFSSNIRVSDGILYLGNGSTTGATIKGFGDLTMINGVSGASYYYASGTSTLCSTHQAGQIILASGLSYGAVNNFTQIINGTTGNISGTTASFSGSITGTTASFSGSINASGNSNTFGNTTIGALSASTGTFSASVTAAGNSNSFGSSTFAGDVNISSPGDLYINSGTSYNNVGSVFLSNQRTEISSIIVDGTAQGDTAINFKTRSAGATASAMFIDEFRNVGIGTTDPGSKLEIYGGGNTLRMDSAGNTAKTFLMRNVNAAIAEIKTDGNLDINIEDASRTMRFLNGNTERMSINSDGLVTLASMSSNDTRQLTFMGDSNSTSGNGGAIGMFADETRITSNWYYNSGQRKYVAGNGQAVIGLSTGTTDATSFIGFGVNGPADSAGPTLRMKITSAGVVQVENTAAAHLILNGDTNNTGDTGQVDGIIDFRGDGNPGAYGYRINTENWSGQTALSFQEYINGAYTSRLLISKIGNVGIGTTTFASTTNLQLKVGNMASGVVGEIYDAVDNADNSRLILCGGNDGAPQFSMRHYSAAYGLDIWMNVNSPWDTYMDNRQVSSGFIWRNNCNADGSEAELARLTGAGTLRVGTASTKIEIQPNGDAYTTQTRGWQLSGAVGNTSYPSYGFRDSGGEGMMSSAATNLSLVCGGSVKLNMDSRTNVAYTPDGLWNADARPTILKLMDF